MSWNITAIFDRINKGDSFPKHFRGVVLTISNWVFQGLLYMDRTERSFKIALDVIGITTGTVILHFWQISLTSLLLVFCITHTLNWLFNCQLFALLKNLGLKTTHREEFTAIIDRMVQEARKEHGIERILMYGSSARGTATEKSDIDLRIVRYPGARNAIRSCQFALKFRVIAVLSKIPLDLYVFDGLESLRKMDPNETPQVVFRNANAH